MEIKLITIIKKFTKRVIKHNVKTFAKKITQKEKNHLVLSRYKK